MVFDSDIPCCKILIDHDEVKTVPTPYPWPQRGRFDGSQSLEEELGRKENTLQVTTGHSIKRPQIRSSEANRNSPLTMLGNMACTYLWQTPEGLAPPANPCSASCCGELARVLTCLLCVHGGGACFALRGARSVMLPRFLCTRHWW